MNETFELPVRYQQEDLLLSACLHIWGYSHHIIVTVRQQEITFEPDEERNYRALIDQAQPLPDLSLVKAIVEALEAVFK